MQPTFPAEATAENILSILQDGIERLKANGTWKRWRCLLTEGLRPPTNVASV